MDKTDYSRPKIKMQEIENYNCDGLCQEKYCSERYTHFTTIEICGLKIIISLCKKHAEEWDNYQDEKENR